MNPTDELNKLIGLFPGSEGLIERAEHIPSSLTPEPYKQMLVHDHHMTVTMESYYNSAMEVRVLEQVLQDDIYCRKILLSRADTGKVVQFGIVRFDFSYITRGVRDEILLGQTPLGRILINNNVLRHIDLGAILRISPGPELRDYLACDTDCTTYGRMATIFCNQQPAVDLLEIPSPLV